ncbi:MAG: branched-chain amino acid transaminase [Gammaproteobacteria bacterium]
MALPQDSGYIWMSGEFIRAEDATVHIMTHSLHYGSGVFEGVRAYDTEKGTAIFRLREHTDRLFNSAKILGMKIPFSKEEIMQAQIATIKKNNLKAGYIRPLVYYDQSTLGLHIEPSVEVKVAIVVWPWGAYLGEDQALKGVRMKTSSFARNHVNASFSKAKATGQYGNCSQASMEAKFAGYDEALMLDCEGYVAEASSANMFIVRHGVLSTPPIDNCLEGITRDSIMHLARDEGLTVLERRFTRDEVYIADEAFLTGTAVEIAPIKELDNRTIGSGKPGLITLKLKEIFFDQVYCRRKEYPTWSVLV